MISIDSKIKIYLSVGITDTRKGMHGLAMLAEEKLAGKNNGEGLFVFRGKKGDRIKILWWDGQGFCLYYKCMDRGKFTWPQTEESGIMGITRGQLGMLIEGIDWRRPKRSNKAMYS